MRRLVWAVAVAVTAVAVGVGCSPEPMTKAECLDRTISALNDADFDDPKIDRKLEAIGRDLEERCPKGMLESLTREESARLASEIDLEALLWLAGRGSDSSSSSLKPPSSALR